MQTPLKKQIKAFIAKYPVLKRNRLYYEVQRFRQLRPCKVDPSLTDRKDILAALVRDGLFVMPDLLTREVCGKILAEIEEPLAQLAAGTYKGPATRHKVLDAYRLHDVDLMSPTARTAFFELPLINDMARAYVAKSAISYRRECDYKAEGIHGNQNLQSELPHFDDWRHRFKAFLYLTDVTESNAPFVFYPRTHEAGAWKRRFNAEFERDGEHGRYGYFFPQEMTLLKEKYGFQEQVITGKAGTLILVDTRGIHRGTTLREGRRVMLNSTFGIAFDRA